MVEGMVGRDQELAAVGSFLEGLDARPGVLLVEGEPGIGKTTVWLAGRDRAQQLGHRVLSCRPIQTETPLAFVALADLLEPILDEALPHLPAPQAGALEVAMLRAEAGARRPDRRTVSAAVLGAIRSLAAPVLLAVDDIQWLDRASAGVLEFVIHRVAEEPVGVLATSRTEEATPLDLDRILPPGHLRRLVVGPLSVGSLQPILRRQLDVTFSRPVLLRIHQASGGNPLFALEIARTIQARGGLRRAEPLPVPDALADAVGARLATLSARVRRRLVVVALLAQPTLGLVDEVFSDPERVGSDLEAAQRAGVIRLAGDRILFTHPLLAAAAVAAATPEQRRRLHGRLASTNADPEERARHLALATVRPDAGVAALLDAAAVAARARGAPDVAAELSEEALRLTPSRGEAEAARRRLDAADHYFAAGESEQARQLLKAVVEACPAGGSRRAEALLRLGILHHHADDQVAAVALLERARADVGDDLVLRSEIEQNLSWAVAVAGDIPRGAEHAQAALELAEQRGEPGAVSRALAMVAIMRFFLGSGVDSGMMQRSLALEEWTEPLPVEWRPSFLHGYMLKQTGEFQAARETLEGVVSRLEAHGDETAVPFLLSTLSDLECWAGNLDRAADHAEAGYALAVQTGQELFRAFHLYSRALVDAHRGQIDRARSLAEEGLAIARRGRLMPAIQFNASVLAFVDLSLGDHAAVHARLGPLADLIAGVGMAEPGIVRFVPDEIEALVALGEVEQAASILEPFEARATALQRSWALATAARCCGLVEAARGDLPAATGALEQALQHHTKVSEPFELARTLLVAGQIHRRNRQKRASKQALDRALEIFEQLGTPLWADKARAELDRVGIRPSAPLGLTATEERVARLVAEGKSNREVAAELFLSRRTVEDNLSRIYRKLGVRSRTQLARSFASGDDLGRGRAPPH